MPQRETRRIMLGNIPIGGGAPVLVQSMATTDTRNAPATLAQIHRLVALGCEAVRVAVPDAEAALALPLIVSGSPVPIIADIHFDFKLALAAIEAGCQGIRINPGNIGNERELRLIAGAVKANSTVIRVGVNSGSLEKSLLRKFGRPVPEALAESALINARRMEDLGCHDIKISIKSSSPQTTIAACRAIAPQCDYPLHLGVTEAGSLLAGSIKNAIAMGALLREGIGDTIRVSLTAPPEEEVRAAWEILRALGLRQRGPEIISCPTCGRTEIDLFGLAARVEELVLRKPANVKVAVMGCPVNGPGEAREADIGIAGGRDKGIVFRKGKIVGSARGEAALLEKFEQEYARLLEEIKQQEN